MEAPVAQSADVKSGAHDTPIARACADGGSDWRADLRAATRSAAELLQALSLTAAQVGISEAAARQFPVLVPPELLNAMETGNPLDPLLRQVLPAAAESHPQPAHFTPDPLAEQSADDQPGIIRKYHGRALLILTGACAVHCRYCFRRHFPYTEAAVTPTRWQGMLDQLRADPELQEVILSGGDPLLVSDEQLDRVLSGLESIPQLRYIRIHSRIPAVLPSRITPALLARLGASSLPMTLVVHCNHPGELTPSACRALQKLRAQGITLLNQSVLLRDINDDADTLAELSSALYLAGVLPYYLHQLDPVAGAAHFSVPDPEALTLHKTIQNRLPGYLVPRLVREVPGAPAKQWLR